MNLFKLALLFFCSIPFISYSALEDHFKSVKEKSDLHAMKNIDFIYMINLDHRPEKFKSCVQQLHPYGIYPYRFSAVHGWELTLEDLNDLGVKLTTEMKTGFWGTSYLTSDLIPSHEIINKEERVYFSHCMYRGAIGIVLSHLSILQDAYDSGYKTIWVMEDDIEIVQDPRTLSTLIEELDDLVGKKNWDVLFTDQDTRNNNGDYVPCFSFAQRPNFEPKDPKQFAKRKNINDTFKRIGARYGAYSMIVRRSGMKKILDFFKTYHIFLPYDMEYTFPKGIKLFSLINDVVSTQVNAISDNTEHPRFKKSE